VRKWVRGIINMALFSAMPFLGAGTIRWTRGWILAAAFVVVMAGMGVLLRRRNPELMRARMAGPGTGTKPFDRIFLRLFIPLVIVQPFIAGLDAVRFHWSSMPFATVWTGVPLFLAATGLICWAMLANPHAEMTVRIQSDRGHVVISRGPYRVVRHPMYVGMILMYAAMNLILGSWWAFTVVGAIVALMVWRIAKEERTLCAELPGYSDYAQQTRWRLVPGLW